jgi:hypothetical protein
VVGLFCFNIPILFGVKHNEIYLDKDFINDFGIRRTFRLGLLQSGERYYVTVDVDENTFLFVTV